MAKAAAHGSKSTAVRAYFRQNPGAGVAEAIEALESQGTTVSTALVSKIKYSDNKPGGKRRRGRKKKAIEASTTDAPATKKKRRKRRKKSARRGTAAKAASADRVSLSELVQAKKLAEQLGGVDAAREAMAALSRLQ